MVTRPTYVDAGPVVVIDQAHRNFHTMDGQYAPFRDLLRADGFGVEPNTAVFTDASLAGVRLLVVANAGLPAGGAADPAFTDEETATVERWVRNGGSLLLIADHAPFGAASATLGARFGVGMGQGWAFKRGAEGGLTSTMTYSRAAGDLGDHPTTRGVERITAFTGQSLTGPPEATVLMRFGPEAWEAATPADLNAADAALRAAGDGPPTFDPGVTAIGARAQGLAFEYGAGRVVVLGEAGMFSAQLIRFPPEANRADRRFGLNVEGHDNAAFALSIMHWLARTDP